MATCQKNIAYRVAVKLFSAAAPKKDYLLSVAIILIAISLSPFALARTGVFPAQFFYIILMPVLLLYFAKNGKIRANSFIVFVIATQSIAIFIVSLAEETLYLIPHLKTIGILLSVGFVSILFSSDFLDIRVFVKVVVLFTIAVLLASVVSIILVYFGYIEPVPLFNREDGEIIYRVGCTLTNEIARAGKGYFIRPSGVFVEPGMLAVYAILAIIANAVVLGNRMYELLLVCFGFFTTTLAFYISLLVFFILFRRWKALAFFAVCFLVVALLFSAAPDIENSLIWEKTIARIQLFFGRNFGDNRYGSTMETLLNLDKLNVLSCIDRDVFYNFEKPGAEATIFGPFLMYGLIGGLFPFLHIFLFAAISFLAWLKYSPQINVPKNMLAIFALLFLNLFHRPFVYHFLYYLYVVAMFEWEWRKIIPEPAGSEIL